MAHADQPPQAANAKSKSRPTDRGVRAIGVIVALVGVVFAVAGVVTYVVVQQTLADEQITVSDDADMFAGKDVAGPFTAYAQADIIAQHAEEIAEGQTYAELDQDDPRRESVMDASFLRASLYTSVVAFGVAALATVLGLLLVLLGWALIRIGKRPAV
jgi:hypothetical protein